MPYFLRLVFFTLLVLLQPTAVAQPVFEENRGQWPEKVAFRTEIPSGALFLEQGALVYHLVRNEGHEHARGISPQFIEGHVVRCFFEGASRNARIFREDKIASEVSYFRGNNPRNWQSGVASYRQAGLHGIYEGISLKYYSNERGLKYDFELEPGVNPSLIALRFEGAGKLSIRHGKLHIETSLGEIIEEAPIAWQDGPEGRIPVDCNFRLKGNVVSFSLGRYNTKLPLTIDPQLVFGTYSGSSADNWGMTATYDNAGNTYSAGVVFGIGYPTTTGAYKEQFSAASGSRPVDIGIIKYSPEGQRIFASYLGGSGNELPQSLVVSSNNELFVFGTTGSADFPTTPDAFSRSFSGGTSTAIITNGITFPNGTDMFVCRFSEDGRRLLASTYVGGSKNDGINVAGQLRYNYADEARGAIFLDLNDQVYIGCSTSSEDFPVTPSSFQPQYGGGPQDGVICRFDPNLNQLTWASFLGGTGADGIYSLTLDSDNNVIVCGGTDSGNFPVRDGAVQPDFGGGKTDAFISAIRPNGQTMYASSFYGSSTYDQAYLVATNRSNEIYVYGQTEAGGSFYQENFGWKEPNGKQFISCFNSSLSERKWSTSFGTGKPKPDITPSAFTVDICGQIFACGWGGVSNTTLENGQIGGTAGLTVTPDAFQQTTDNSDFYLIVLKEADQSLVYATFFGGDASADHVDGGTSRFDRRGVVYQSVCAGCGGKSDFPTTPGVWSPLNGSGTGCNNAVFKFDFQLPATVSSFTSPSIGCSPMTVDFTNSSQNATSYTWKVNGQEFSNDVNPGYTFNSPGTYIIELTAENPESCNRIDVFRKQIRVVASTSDVFDDLEACFMQPVQIGPPFPIDPYYSVSWTPEQGLDDPFDPSPNAMPWETTEYQLILSLGSCADEVRQKVLVQFDTSFNAGPDLSICRGQTIFIGHPGDTTQYSYFWSPTSLIENHRVPLTKVSPDESASYQLIRVPHNFENGCSGIDSVAVFIPEGAPLADFETEIQPSCTGVTVKIWDQSELADEILWDLGKGTGTAPEAVYHYGDSIQIRMIVSNAVCSDTLDFDAELEPLAKYFKVNDSNAFSPNGDGINDCFSPALQDLPAPNDKSFIECSTLRIYNRWGNLVFESVETAEGCWDGNDSKGNALPEGTYFFLFEGQGISLQGNVTLLR